MVRDELVYDGAATKHEIVQDNIKKGSRWMVLAGQAKSSSALERIEKCKCSYKLSSWNHLIDYIIRTHLRNTFHCD